MKTLEARRAHPAVLPLALTLGVLAACKPERAEDLPVRARATVLPGEGPPRVRIEVETSPNAQLDVMNLTIANDPVPQNSPMLFGSGLRADAQGRWSGEAELSPRSGAEQLISVNVEGEVASKRPFSHEMLRSLGRTTVAVPVPFRMYTDPERHTLRASGPAIFFARLDRECANLSLEGLPEGATFRMNGASARAVGGVAALPFPRLERISALRTDALLETTGRARTPRAPVDAAVEVQLADGTVQRGTHRLTDEVEACALRYLVSVQRGAGVPMEPEGDASVTLVVATGFGRGSAGVTAVAGTHGPLSNVRAVVLSTAERRPFGCGAYVSASGRTVNSSAEREALTLVAYDRRTGASLGRTTLLAPPPRCLATISGGGGSNGLSSVPGEEIVRWVSRL